jgi:DNA-binding transcriptional ArsR family regulator
MTAPPADRLFEVLGEATVRDILRRVLAGPATQAELKADVGCDQSTVSRTTTLLRALGLIESSGGGRSPKWVPVHRDELVGVLLAADRLADAVIREASEQQAQRSTDTRRLAMRPAEEEPAAEQDP